VLPVCVARALEAGSKTMLNRQDDTDRSAVRRTYRYDVLPPPACSKERSRGCGAETVRRPWWRTPRTSKECLRGRSGLRSQCSSGNPECGNDAIGRATPETCNARSTEAVHRFRIDGRDTDLGGNGDHRNRSVNCWWHGGRHGACYGAEGYSSAEGRWRGWTNANSVECTIGGVS
jgi:hypothetical protein